MYEPFPDSRPGHDRQRLQPPRSVANAVKLMYVGAGLDVIELIVNLVTRGSLKSAILKAHPAYTTAQLHAAEISRTASLAIAVLIVVGLWLWMAWANGKGKDWARILSAVFFGISTLSLISSLVLRATTDVIVNPAAADQVVGALIWLVGLAAIVLLFRRESAPFYHRQAERR